VDSYAFLLASYILAFAPSFGEPDAFEPRRLTRQAQKHQPTLDRAEERWRAKIGSIFFTPRESAISSLRQLTIRMAQNIESQL
jgi:hypothetical protein